MAIRPEAAQSEHDKAIEALAELYRQKGKDVWINPGSEKNKSWSSHYIDVIVVDKIDNSLVFLIEVETEDSVSEDEAKKQWQDYDTGFTKGWNLAVPVESLKEAFNLVQHHRIDNCYVLPWRKLADGTYKFFGLPGV